MNTNRIKIAVSALALTFGVLAVSQGQAQAAPRTPKSLAEFQQAERVAKAHIATFDALDFDVFSNQKWERLHESHAANVIVHWPDGHTTQGIDKHISDLKWLFTFAPDTRIKVHPVKLGKGEWTAVTGIMEGTFTRPMTLPDGTVIQPTGKAFRLPMATVGHWVNGTMDEEYLYWDNKTYFEQMGVK